MGLLQEYETEIPTSASDPKNKTEFNPTPAPVLALEFF